MGGVPDPRARPDGRWMMIQAHIDRESGIPWWAAFGAPLLVVPLMVALLAIWAPRHGSHAVLSSETGVEAGQLQMPSQSAVVLPPESARRPVRSRS